MVLASRLRAHLARRYLHLPAKALDEAVVAARNPDGVTVDQRNMNFQKLLTRGYELKYEVDGQDRFEHIYFIDWDDPDTNDFLVVNQLTVEGQNARRPDQVIYVNGLPLVIFELNSPWDEYANVAGAYNQLQHYPPTSPACSNSTPSACCRTASIRSSACTALP